MSITGRSDVPLYLGSEEGQLFGWYHPPLDSVRRCGVVVCNPIGDEYQRAHRTLRRLALRLQQAGFPVVRFDFHGTGDSAGDEADPDRVSTWLADIGRAIDALKMHGGSSEICIAGLRLGGTLATAMAAERGGVDSLVLWQPVASGRAALTEIVRQHRLHRLLEPHGFASEPPGWDPGGQQALGFLLTPATVSGLERIDLGGIARAPARRALVVDDGDRPASIVEALRRAGVETEQRQLGDHDFLITSPQRATVPEPVIEAMAEWLETRHPERRPQVAAAAVLPASCDGVEQPLLFGRDRGLFGVLARPPLDRRDAARPAIVVLNAGTVHRVGPHRIYVKMARRWAQQGFSVLRLDLSGIGDSLPATGCAENLPYPRDALVDVQAAMDALGSATGAQRFVLVGLCSGADLAFDIALREPRVVGTVLLNPLTFRVHDQALIESYQPATYYSESFLDPAKIKRLLRGEVQVGRALASLARNVLMALQRRRANRRVGDAMNDVPALLGSLADRGVDTLLVVSENDPGVSYVDHHFAAGMRALARRPQLRRVDLPGTDHTFTSLFAQAQVIDTITQHLEERHR